MQDRRVLLEGVHNFRDFGGYLTADGRRVRRGQLYRSGHLAQIRKGAVPRFLALGIRLVIDLRTDFERTERPCVLPAAHGIKIEHLPLSVMPELEKKWTQREMLRFLFSREMVRYGPEYMEEAYRALARRAAGTFQKLFSLLSDPANHPVLLHCTAGRDRTGLAVAMVLSTLGVPEAALLEDYGLTNELGAAATARRLQLLRMLSLFRVTRGELRSFLEVRPSYLEAALREMQEMEGTVAGYLRTRAGVAEDQQEKLRVLLLEDSVLNVD